MTDATPLFLLQTANGCLEVARFVVNNWGISRHYSMELFLTKANQGLSINEQVILQVDDQCYHGMIQEISQSPSYTRLRLVSRLEAKLHFTQSRVYSALCLSQLIKTVLSEAGLLEGLDFELALDDAPEKIWIHQDNEQGLAFFKRIIATYGLVFTTVQQDFNALCIISDSMDKLPKEPLVSLSMQPASGFNQQQSMSDVSLYATLCHQSVFVQDYDYQKAACSREQKTSRQAYAKGCRSYNGYVSLDHLKQIQAASDEQAQSIRLVSQTLLKPGQPLIFKNAQFLKNKAHVSSLKIVGEQKQAMGALPIEEQETLHRSRLEYQLCLSLDLTGQIQENLQYLKPASSFRTARIEHRPGRYPDLCPSGQYHIRLADDEQPEQKSLYPCSPKTKASPRLRNALYYAGNDYGFSHPYAQGSEVILAYENGHQQRPLIIAALPNQQAQSVVTHKNRNDALIASRYGSYLLLKDEDKGKSLVLSTAEKKNYVRLKQNQDNAQFTVESSLGEIHIKALERLSLETKNQYRQLSKLDQQLWIEGDTEVHSEKGHLSLEADHSTTIHSVEQMKLYAKQQDWTAKDKVRVEAYQAMHIKSENNMSLISEEGQQHWRNKTGTIYLKASQSLTLKAGGSSIELTTDEINFKTQGLMQLNAKNVHGLG